MANDPLFDAQLPRWWDRTAFLIRGLALGFLLGYLFSLVIAPNSGGNGPIVVIALSLVVALLPSLPNAWIEQRNRVKALRDGTLMREIERKNNSSNP